MTKRELLEAIETVSLDADIIIGFTMSKEELEKYPGDSLDEKEHVVYTVEKHIGELDVSEEQVWIDLGEDYTYEKK